MRPQTWLYKSAAFEGEAFPKNTSLTNSLFTKEKIKEIDTYLKEESETTSMIVLEHGKVVYEYGDVSEVSYNASVRKSILAMLYGKHVENGTINLNQTIGNLGIDEDDGLLAIEKQATVDHIITARSGVFHEAANGGYDTKNVKKRGSVQPGTYFLYNNWDYNVAVAIFEQYTGKTIYQELEEQLAIPLGFQDWNILNQDRTVNTSKSRYPAYHMHLSTRDMAKIGQLMLQEGRWKGKQLISKDWIKKITTSVTPKDTVNQRTERDLSNPVQHSYGYMWWLFERFYDNPDFEGAYTASGAYGQFITVIPKRAIVVVHKTTVDIYTLLNFSDRTSTPSWRYWWILQKLMQNRKPIAELAKGKSTEEVIDFLRVNHAKETEYDISEGLINRYAENMAKEGRYEEAIQFCELILELYPEGYYTHRTYDNYIENLRKLGRTNEALPWMEKSFTVNPWNKKLGKEIERLKNE
jgi:CubicO group peptidase (beta-lactamase class C family)